MADIADMLVASGLESSKQPIGDYAGSLAKGVQLGATIENMRVQREQLDQQKQQLQMQKAVAVTDTLKLASTAKDRNLKNFLLKKVLPAKINALGMSKFFTPETLEMIQTSDEAQRKVLGMQMELDQKIRSGEMTAKQAMDYAQKVLQDSEMVAMLDTDQVFDAQKFRYSEEGKSARAQQAANAAIGKQIQGQEAAGDVTLRQETSRAYNDYITEGGRAVVQANLKNLDEAERELRSGNVQTGKGLIKYIGGSDTAVDLAAPEVARVRDKLRSSIVSTLRPILGGAFAEKEGQRILDLGFNPRLPTEENANRMANEISKLKDIVKTKEGQFVKQGLMQPNETSFGGGSEKKASGNGFKATDAQRTKFKALPPAEQEKALQGLVNRFGQDVKDIKKELGL